jgi:hypothetical protein
VIVEADPLTGVGNASFFAGVLPVIMLADGLRSRVPRARGDR